MLRETVRQICADFGPEYTRRKTAAERAADASCGTRSPSRGFLGVNLPEEYGGGGLGMSALAAVGEEIAASGCSLLLIVVSPAIVGSILVRHGNDGAEGHAGCAASRPARRRSRSRSPSPAPARTRTTSRPPRGAPTAAT